MQNRVYRCSYLQNSRIGNHEFSYADDNILIHVKDVDGRYNGELLHTHNFFEFDLILAGRGKNISNNGEIDLEPGYIVYGTPANFHSIGPLPGETMTVVNISFAGKHEQLAIEAFNTLDGFALKLSEDDFDFICSEIEGILSCNLKNGARKRMFVKGAAEKILSVVAEAYENSPCRNEKVTSDVKVHTALLYIRKNFNKPLKIGDVAKHVGYSEDYLSQLIKKATRMNFSSYLLSLRLENAYMLLMENERTIQQICLAVGYSSYTNFYYAFKKRFGITPGEITKRSHRENVECFIKNNGQKPLTFDENNKLIWR